MGKRQIETGTFFAKNGCGAQFMGIVCIGMQETYCDRPDVLLAQFFRRRAQFNFVQLQKNRPVCSHPLGSLETQGPLYQRFRPHERKIVLIEAVAIRKGERIAKPPGGQQGRPRATPLDDGIGRKCRSMNCQRYARGRNSGNVQHAQDTVHDTPLGCIRCGQHLAGMARAGHFEHDVGESTANINRKPAIAHSFPLPA